MKNLRLRIRNYEVNPHNIKHAEGRTIECTEAQTQLLWMKWTYNQNKIRFKYCGLQAQYIQDKAQKDLGLYLRKALILSKIKT